MFHFYSTMQSQFGFTVTVVPLPPGHAHNLTDGLFARLNTLFNKLKRQARLVGYKAYARALCRGVRTHVSAHTRTLNSFRPHQNDARRAH